MATRYRHMHAGQDTYVLSRNKAGPPGPPLSTYSIDPDNPHLHAAYLEYGRDGALCRRAPKQPEAAGQQRGEERRQRLPPVGGHVVVAQFLIVQVQKRTVPLLESFSTQNCLP